MSDPFFLVDAVSAGPGELDGPEGHHAADVQRLRVGERLILGDGRGTTAPAEVVTVRRGGLGLRVGEPVFRPAADPRLVVAQGIAKGDRGELAVQTMTEVGVDHVVPWSAARSVAQWKAERGEKARQRWVDTAREASKQARRPWVATVGPAASTKDVDVLVRDAALALVLHEEAALPLTTVDLPEAGDILVVVGPEGGIAAEELAGFTDQGGLAVRLGSTVLRTSTAGVAALAVLSARLGRW
jgi:16S rRNA (uracil1498-N3)-methyltransferase